jgi:hypothetical protein
MYFLYCESPQFLNAISNIVFITLAAWFWNNPSAIYHRYGLLLIAVTSMVWHVTEQQWALWLDSSAIAIWALLYAIDAARVFRKPTVLLFCTMLLSLIIFALLAKILSPIFPMFSGAFLPFALLGVFLSIMPKFSTLPRQYWLSSSIFAITAIILRESDLPLCTHITIGTHWLWHIFAGCTLLAPIATLKRKSNTP